MGKIEWTDATWNPIGGCSIKSPGCSPCYAQQLAGTRLRNHPLYAGVTDQVKGKFVFNGKLTIQPADHPIWRWPLAWSGAAKPILGADMPSLIFVGDMSDLFHEDRETAHVDRVIASIVYSRHIGQLLTKRPNYMAGYFDGLQRSPRWLEFIHPIVGKPNFDPMVASFDAIFQRRFWLGFSAERQKEFDERWPHMRVLACMGFTIFVSYEPAIGPLTLPADFLALGKGAQVIAGGMSGRDATPAHPDWFRSVRDECAEAGVPFFFKQWGEFAPGIAGTNGTAPPHRVGKKAAGRMLDGCEWSEFPRVAA